jgi:hypothetical protein
MIGSSLVVLEPAGDGGDGCGRKELRRYKRGAAYIGSDRDADGQRGSLCRPGRERLPLANQCMSCAGIALDLVQKWLGSARIWILISGKI